MMYLSKKEYQVSTRELKEIIVQNYAYCDSLKQFL